jgi:type I restriction enzyme S subunit
MVSEWPEVPLEEIKATSKHAFAMGPFGSRIKVENFVEDGVPVIKGANLNGTYLVDDGFSYLSEAKADELIASNAKKLDLVITHRGTIGQVGIIPEASKYDRYVASQSQLKLTLDQSRVDPYFVYYFLRSEEGQRRLLMNASQVGVPAIARALSAMKSLRVPLPMLAIQRGITLCLRLMDDRIEVARQANANLEAIAQALFKSWFVDFDPVHAKTEGRELEGMDAATAALFPRQFDESELGPIPRGWRIQTLGDAFEINPKRTLKRGTNSKYLDMASLPTIGHVPVAPVDRPFSSGSRFSNGDTLLARITPCLENGKTAHVDFLAADEVAWGSTEFIVLRPCHPLPPYFGYLLARQKDFRAFAIQAMSGTSGRQRVEIGRLEQFRLAVPGDGVAARFGEAVESIRDSIRANAERSETLASLRDTLLPRLISGKLRLPEAESLVEDAIA